MLQPDLSSPPSVLPPHPYTFSLDPFQQHALAAIALDENVLVCAKTGSGKTLVGEYQCWHSLQKSKRVFYTTPIKSLSNQKFYDLKHMFPQARVGIMTGDIKFCPDADIVVMTTEILRNLLYKRGTATEHLGLTASLSLDGVDAIIFDECHYINDRDRGCIWEETMILLPPAIRMIMLSATLDHPEYLATWLGSLKGVPVHLIQTQYRVVPLTHSVILSIEDKWLTVMDAREVYHAPAYIEWYRKTLGAAADERAFQRRVMASGKRGGDGPAGAVEGKTRTHSFSHRMNDTITMLNEKELLPALFFVLSRVNCETYAAAVEHSLLDTSDAAAVEHMIGFHLHRYHLDAVPQYHQIRALLLKGVAFHHSGLLPVLKEIVEILFTKGYVRVLFCTETFAVGLNMPTKTVVFTGFKKYDDATDSMRLLRTDEYMQMAGRAGRRGKDTQGIVLYVPDRDPITPEEMERMMKGARPPVESRMQFGYEFLLKTLQSSVAGQPLRWLQVIQDSYWFQQQEKERTVIAQKREALELQRVHLEEPYASDCAKRVEMEEAMRGAVNAERKALQRQLDSIKNRQMGPRWTKALETYHAQRVIDRELHALVKEEAALQSSALDQMDAVAKFLCQMGYLEHADLQHLTVENLGMKGILATEVNEAHPILLTELYQEGALHSLTGNELVAVLACFLESKGVTVIPAGPVGVAIQRLQSIAAECESVERATASPCSPPRDWSVHTEMVEPLQRWIAGENAATLCAEYEIFEGNLLRAVMKVANMLDECLALATYCQHTDQVEKIQEVRGRMIRDVAASDSLYLRL